MSEEGTPPDTPLDERRPRNVSLLFRFLARSLAVATILALLVFGPVVIVLAGVAPDLSTEGFLLAFLLLLAIAAIAGVWSARRLWKQIGARVLVFPDRLVWLRRQESVAFPWNELEEFCCWGVSQYSTVMLIDQQFVETEYHYRFRHRDGHGFDFSEKFDSKDARPLAAHVEEGLLEYRLPELRRHFLQEQESLTFGPFVLQPEGLRYRRRLLPWNEVDYVFAEDGKIRVRKRDKFFNWCAVKMGCVPNGSLFLALAKERMEQEQTGPG